MKIISPVGYPWTFTGPKNSNNDIKRCLYIPFNKLVKGSDGVTFFSPLDTFNCKLIHAFNRIPLNFKKFVIGFESHLPRTFGVNNNFYKKMLYNALLSERCRKIIAISKYSENIFTENLVNSNLTQSEKKKLLSKICLIYPSINISEDYEIKPDISGQIIFTFVGNHFLRKGGAVVLEMARIAIEKKLPFQFNIISKMEMGESVWSDPISEKLNNKYINLLNLKNVKYFNGLENSEVLNLLKNSHFSILTTFADTFGFSAVESMMLGTPVIATNHGALPEFIINQKTGILIEQPVTEGDNFWNPNYYERAHDDVINLFKFHVERISNTAIDEVCRLISSQENYYTMRQNSRTKVIEMFDSNKQDKLWDNLYLQALD